MVIGTLQVTIQIPAAQSLKEKRRVTRSLGSKLRNTFNVAVAEIDYQDSWQLATFGIVAVSSDGRHADEMCQKALDMVRDAPESLITGSTFELIHV